MGDRIRLGEVLAAVGSIVLIVQLLFGTWYDFTGDGGSGTVAVGAPAYAALFTATGSVGASYLGWFALLLAGASAASGLWFVVRSVTSRTTERPMLQGPVAYAFTLLAFIVVGLRLLLGNPEYTIEPSQLPAGVRGGAREFDLSIPLHVAPGAWVALFAIWVLLVGLWVAMSDDRVHAKGPRARTAALLGGIATRPAPPANGGSPDSDASVVADDALPTEETPFNPSIRPSGGPA